MDCFALGCKWTVEYFVTGLLGAWVAVLILPGSYTTLPRFIKLDDGERRISWGAVARLIVGGITGCIVDTNTRNAFFGGFFSWHAFRWLSEDGWRIIVAQLRAAFALAQKDKED